MYNNSFHFNIDLISYEIWYGRKCITPLCWFDSRSQKKLFKKLLRTTQSKQKIMQTRKGNFLNSKNVIIYSKELYQPPKLIR